MRRQHPLDQPAVRRDQALHAEADAQHGHGSGGQDRPADGEVGRVGGVAGAGREHDVVEGEDVRRGGVVVLDDVGQRAGHGREQVHEVPRVGVVVVDDHDARLGVHPRNLSPTCRKLTGDLADLSQTDG